MFGKNLAEPVSPFEAEGSKKAASTAGGSSRHRHSSTYDKDGSLVHLGRKCLWLRAKDSSVHCKTSLLREPLHLLLDLLGVGSVSLKL